MRPATEAEHQAQEVVHLHRGGLVQRQARALQHGVADGGVGGVEVEALAVHAMRGGQRARAAFRPGRHLGLVQARELGARVVRPAVQAAGARHRRHHHVARRHRFFDHPQRHRLRGRDRLPREQHLHRVAEGCQPRQALRAAGAGQETPAHFGNAQLQLRVVGHHALAAGQRQFQPAAERQPVDGGDPGLGAVLQPHELASQAAAGLEHLLVGGGLRLVGVAAHHHQVGAGQEAGLAAGDDDALHLRVVLGAVHQLVQRVHQAGREHVHRAAGHVDDGEQHAVAVERRADEVFGPVFHAQLTYFLKSGLRRSLKAFTPSFDSSVW
ncbi:MAG: hypothetical protein U1F50_01550 [Rubrivivax sp.]